MRWRPRLGPACEEFRPLFFPGQVAAACAVTIPDDKTKQRWFVTKGGPINELSAKEASARLKGFANREYANMDVVFSKDFAE